MPRNGMTMRDGSTDYETGWLYDNYYGRVAPDLASGFAGFGDAGSKVSRNISRIQAPGQRYIADALRDPEARPILLALLASTSNPSEVLARQAEKDLAESVKSTGKVIVFKSLVRKLSWRLKAAEDALVRATDPTTPEGRTVVGIVATSNNPVAEVREFLQDVALAAVAPDAEFLDDASEELGELGKSFMKKIRKAGAKVVQKIEKVAHNPNVRKAYLAAAVVAAVAITGGAILPALMPAATAVAGGAGAAFAAKGAGGATKTQEVWDPVRGEMVTQTVDATTGQPVTTPPAGGGFDFSKVAGAAIEIYKLKQTGEVAKAGILHQQMVDQLKAQGLSEEAAQAAVNRGEQEAQQAYAQQQGPAPAPQYMPQYAPPGGGAAPSEASMLSPDTVKYGLIAIVTLGAGYGIYQSIKGGGRGGRRSSRRR